MNLGAKASGEFAFAPSSILHVNTRPDILPLEICAEARYLDALREALSRPDQSSTRKG